MTKNINAPIIVTTIHKGVFFGYGIPSDAKTIRITDARMCVYWASSVRGVLGLAATGPNKECRVTKPIPAITLNDVTSIMEVSAEAEAAWKEEKWEK